MELNSTDELNVYLDATANNVYHCISLAAKEKIPAHSLRELIDALEKVNEVKFFQNVRAKESMCDPAKVGRFTNPFYKASF
jgi:hypothetical protein